MMYNVHSLWTILYTILRLIGLIAFLTIPGISVIHLQMKWDWNVPDEIYLFGKGQHIQWMVDVTSRKRGQLWSISPNETFRLREYHTCLSHLALGKKYWSQQTPSALCLFGLPRDRPSWCSVNDQALYPDENDCLTAWWVPQTSMVCRWSFH